MTQKAGKEKTTLVRVAIYTRKSSEQGLHQQFNSLDAQREYCERYVRDRAKDGWTCLPERYDDGGFSGGKDQRPALLRLLKDVKEGKVDCLLVYRGDRLYRSVSGFSRTLEMLAQHGVIYASATEAFNSDEPSGKFMMYCMQAVAQYERELASVRTRDKIAGARRRGLWAGGRPVLGYDIEPHPGGNKLKVNRAEAKRVKRIFEMYLECDSIREVIIKLEELGWKTKQWTTLQGKAQGGARFSKSRLYELLTNVTYLGKIKHKELVYDGLHEAIVDQELFDQVGRRLTENRSADGKGASNMLSALLKGLVRCKACGCAMSHHFTTVGSRRYRYYVCVNQRNGRKVCADPSISAPELERLVIDEIALVFKDDTLIAETVRRVQAKLRADLASMRDERLKIEKTLRELRAEVRVGESGTNPDWSPGKSADLRGDISVFDRQLVTLQAKINALKTRVVDEDELSGAVEAFEPLWRSLTSKEQERLVHQLIHSVEYDSEGQNVNIAFNGMETSETAAEESSCKAA